MKAFFGLVVGLLISLGLAKFAGESPAHVFAIISKSAFGTWEDLSQTLFYTTSLIFAGLSVSMAFHAGLFNIGAEGQLTVAAAAATAVGVLLPQVPYPLAPLLAMLAALLAGAFWGFIPGVLKAYRGSHEVIVTMMMNFVAGGVTSWLIQGALKSTTTQNPESAKIGAGYLLVKAKFIADSAPNSPMNSSFFIAIFLAFVLYFVWDHTVFGYELRVVGQNDVAAEISGINTKKVKMLALSIAGAIAGFVAMNEILGSAGKFRFGFSPDYGFTGIAVALLARNNPLAILLSAFLFGILHKGALDLDMETQMINKDFAKIIQAVIIFSVASFYFLDSALLEKIKKGLPWNKRD